MGAQKYRHLFLGEVTLWDESLTKIWDTLPLESFVTVIDANGETASAKVRTLEPFETIEIPASQRSLNTLADEIYENNVRHGFTAQAGEETNIDRHLMLIVGEVAEAQEELRSGHGVHEVYYREDGKPEGFGMEIADAIIRALGLAAELELDIDALVRDKMSFNETRPYKHGREF